MEAAPFPVEKVIANEVLERRAIRKRNYTAEERAMEEIRREQAGPPPALLQKVADVALQLCRAQSAGISLLEEKDGQRAFRWQAVAGPSGDAQVAEALMVPFSVRASAVGTLWVVSHDPGRQFDREDKRVLLDLARFAAKACERLSPQDLH
ncbi:MAG TPA: hypothetical protein VI321_04355 [Burkholderiales bacterium]